MSLGLLPHWQPFNRSHRHVAKPWLSYCFFFIFLFLIFLFLIFLFLSSQDENHKLNHLPQMRISTKNTTWRPPTCWLIFWWCLGATGCWPSQRQFQKKTSIGSHTWQLIECKLYLEINPDSQVRYTLNKASSGQPTCSNVWAYVWVTDFPRVLEYCNFRWATDSWQGQDQFYYNQYHLHHNCNSGSKKCIAWSMHWTVMHHLHIFVVWNVCAYERKKSVPLLKWRNVITLGACEPLLTACI